MEGKYIIIKPDGEVSVKVITESPSLSKYQEDVGGHIESVPMFDTIRYNSSAVPCVAFCNEKGKMNNLPLNVMATRMWELAAKGKINDVLVGNIVVITGDDDLMASL